MRDAIDLVTSLLLAVVAPIAIAAALVLGPSVAVAAPLPTGSAFIASTGGTCGGSLTTTSCRLATVSCKGLWDPHAKRIFSIDDLNASLKVTDPSGSAIGTIVTFLGGGSTGLYESAGAAASTDFLTPALTAGYRVVQVAWESNGGLGAWGGSPSSSSYGGDGYPDGPAYLACRPATLLRAIAEDTTLVESGDVYLATGQSGGSSQLTYSLTRYGLGDYLDGVVLSGGPPIGDLERGCHGLTISGWPTECATYATVGGTPCTLLNNALSGQFVDSAWNDGSQSCALQRAPYVDHVSRSLGYQSALGGAAKRRFAYTRIYGLHGDADASEAVTLGRRVLGQLVDSTGSAVVSVTTTGGVGHTVPAATSGAQALAALMLGGTYNGTTYTAMTRTRPSPAASTWTPESLPGVELWLHTHATAHLWVEPHTSQGLTHPTADGDVVRGIDEPTQGHHMLPSTVELGSTAASNSHLVLNRADSDYVQVLNSGTAFDFMHKTGVFWWATHFGAASDGTLMTLFDTANASTLNHGVLITKTAANRVRFAVTRGSSGTYVFDCTSSASLTASMGVVPIWFAAGGAGGARFKVGSGAVETCARSNAPGTGSAAQIAWIGRASGGGNAADGRLQDMVITSKIPSPADITAFEAWNPARTSTSLVRWVGADRGFYNFLVRDYDFTGLHSMIYSDTAGSTPIAANAGIALLRSSHDPDGSLGRDLTQSTAANRPTWISGGLTGAGADFDGSNDNLDFTQSISRGAHTWIVVGSNRDATNGTHFVASTGARILAVGPGYSGVAVGEAPGHTAGQVYTTTHPSSGNICPSDLPQQGQTASDYNVIVTRREGSAWSGGVMINGVIGNACTTTNSSTFVVRYIGTPQIAGWELDGRVRRVTEWAAQLTDAQVERLDTCLRWPEAC